MKRVLLSTLFWLAACAPGTYVQPGAGDWAIFSHASVATDSDRTKGLEGHMVITEVDGVDLYRNLRGFPETALLTPGMHKMRVLWGGNRFYAGGCVRIYAEAGKNYKIRIESVLFGRVRFWVEDQENGQVVGDQCAK